MSQHDDERPDQATPPPGEPQGGWGTEDTRPLGAAGDPPPAYPSPSEHGPWTPPQQTGQQPPQQTGQQTGQQLGQQPGPGYPPQPGPYAPPPGRQNPYAPAGGFPAPPGGPAGPFGPGPAQPTAAFPVPYPGPHPGAQPQHAQRSSAASRFPGWAWPAMVALALVVGGLAGVVTSALVATSVSGDGGLPVISTDNGAADPLEADNGSISAVAAKLLPSTVQVQSKGGSDGSEGGGATGSGFVLDSQHHVVTNNHVVADATGKGEIKVVDQNGRKHDATIVGRSPVYDIAVLDVSGGAGLQPAAIGASSKLRVGDTVVALGSPLGLSSTVTSGIVSATDRPVTTGNDKQSSYINALQTDAAINPGNSGGPLVNMRGQVVGVNSAIATTGGALGGGSGNIGVGFAIPMEQVRVTAAQILATGEARYPVIGANVNTGPQSGGAEVVDAPPAGSPAADAGLRKGDVVTEVEGKPVTNGIGLIVAIRSHQPGETVDLRVTRAGKQRDVQVKLDSKVDPTS